MGERENAEWASANQCGLVCGPLENFIVENVGKGTNAIGTALKIVRNMVTSGITDKITESAGVVPSKADKPYKRPTQTTSAQRRSVQGKPCAKCGVDDGGKRNAGHKQDMVYEHHETGKVDVERARRVESVQPECSHCSNRGGGLASAYSKMMNKLMGWK